MDPKQQKGIGKRNSRGSGQLRGNAEQHAPDGGGWVGEDPSPAIKRTKTPVAELVVSSNVIQEQESAANEKITNKLKNNMSYGRKKMKAAIVRLHSESRGEPIPNETSDALAKISKSGPGNKALRHEGLDYLKTNYPGEYSQFMGRYEGYAMGDESKKFEFLKKYRVSKEHDCIQPARETARHSHNPSVVAGCPKYIPDCIYPAVEGTTPKVATIFDGIPSALMGNLIQTYGSVQPGGYTEVFGKKATFITMSKLHERIHKQPNKPARKRKAPEDSASIKKDNQAKEHLFRSRDNKAERQEAAYKNLISFYTELNLGVPKWVQAERACYMMDGDFVLNIGKGGDRATGAQLKESNRKAADSSLFSEMGVNGNLQMSNLVARILHAVVQQKEEAKEAEVRQDNGNDGEGVQDFLLDRPHRDEKIDFDMIEDFLLNTEKACNFNSGIIRQPKAPLHQPLHVDNSEVLNWNCTRKILTGQDCSPEEWLKCGYVIDLPLSQEGSWIRLALPDQHTKTFVLHWVYIPYGSMLIRSLAVFHSGHYGRPGNCRYHATFTVGNTTVDASKILYLRGLLGKNSWFQGWKLAWHKGIPESCQGPDGYESISWKDAQAQGNAYFEKYIQPWHSSNWFRPIMWNLSPYQGLVQVKKRGKVKREKKAAPG